jgi:hypothetical protein
VKQASDVIAELAAEAAGAAPTAASVSVESAPVCKNIKVTGSKVSRRVCMTPEDMAARERAAEGFKRDVQQRTGIVGVAPPNPLAPSN